jgi:hypothetical protein
MQHIATSYGPDNLGLESWQGQTFFLLLNPQTGFGAHTASYFMGTEEFCRELSGPRFEVDHSPSFSVEVKNEWSNTSNPVHGVERDNITFALYIQVKNLVCDVAYVLLLLITSKEVYWGFC